MSVDRSFISLNKEATRKITSLISGLDTKQMATPVGQHWTISTALVHLAFWDRRVLNLVETIKQGLEMPPSDIEVVNDISLPLWLAVPPQDAVRLFIQSAETLDRELENLDPQKLETLNNIEPRWVNRWMHRNDHIQDIENALHA